MAKIKKDVRRKAYSEADVRKCLQEIKQGIPVRRACFRNRVPRSTIKFRLGARCKEQGRTGPPTALGAAEEKDLAGWIIKMARKGFPVTKYRVMSSVTTYIEEHPDKGNFKTGKPSRSWFKSFMNRHKELAIRKPESVTNASANVVELNIRKWFAEVYELLLEEGLVEILRNAKCVLNGDESSFYLEPTVDKVIALRGQKNVYKVDQGPAKKNITVMFTCSANGKMYPPMVVFQYKKTPTEVIQSVPADWGIGKSDSGWMTTDCFRKYIKYVLHPQLVEEDALPAIYFIDGHSSHMAWETAAECRKLGIHLVCLYPNCTRILQPLDVAVFKPLKTAWLRVVQDWKLKKENKYLRSENFSPLLVKAIDAVEDKVIVKGFECCGLFPFDMNKVDYSKCLGRNPSLTQPEEQAEAGGSTNEHSRLSDSNSDPSAECRPKIANDVTATSTETVSVNRRKAEEILQLMGPDRRAMYQTRDADDFESLDEIILARVFKLLEPLNCKAGVQDHLETTEENADHSTDSVEPTEEILAEYLIDETEHKFEGRYILEIDHVAPVEDAAANNEKQVPDHIDHDQTGADALVPKDEPQNHSLLSGFLDSPETPHRKGTKRYKRRSPAVLTSRRRLMYHKAVAEEKKKEVEEKQKKLKEKQMKAEERKIKQAQKTANKKTGKYGNKKKEAEVKAK